MVVVIAVMAVTAIGCFVRDRMELVQNIYEFENHLADKIPLGGFFSFVKTDIVEDKYFEKRADFGPESDNMSLGANIKSTWISY